jgi:hypothetical protein
MKHFYSNPNTVWIIVFLGDEFSQPAEEKKKVQRIFIWKKWAQVTTL